MPTTKCQFTLPAGLMADVNQLTSTKKGVGLGSLLSRTTGRFSRDRYLSDILRDELTLLERVPENSPAAAQLMREDMLEARQRMPFKQLNIFLERSVAVRLGALCRKKRIPRDDLMQLFLTHVVSGLERARNIANSPTESIWLEEDPYRRLYLSDDDVLERRESVDVIEAIASKKGIGVGAAHEAYWQLPPEKRQRVRNNTKIKATVEELKKRSADVGDLAEFLPPADRRRLRIAAGRKARTSKRRRSK